jgi:HSP20 family protein
MALPPRRRNCRLEPLEIRQAELILRVTHPPPTEVLAMFGSLFGSFDSRIFDEFRLVENELDQLVGRFAPSPGIRATQRAAFPPVNVGATPERVEVYVFAAGIEPKNLDMSIQQNLLIVSGSRKVPMDEQADYYRKERFDGEFRRVIALPDDVDPDRVDATYRDGVLHFTVQRREAARARQITVN